LRRVCEGTGYKTGMERSNRRQVELPIILNFDLLCHEKESSKRQAIHVVILEIQTEALFLQDGHRFRMGLR